MNDRELRDALRSLPAPRASRDFTASVLRRLDGRRFRPWGVQPRWVLTVASLALAVAAGWWGVDRHREIVERQALVRESTRLEQEIEALRREIASVKPVVYVGGTEDVDFVLDLSRFEPSGAVRPAGL